MKASRYNKILGLAIGEKSILAAEVVAGGGGSGSGAAPQPEARRLAEFELPPEAPSLATADPAQLGKLLGDFLREQKFTARHAVIGLPAKWLLVKTKEVPPADAVTVADLLRLQAEGEFSSELKDLVFDYAGEPSPAGPRNVLLVATPRKYLDLVAQLCEAARIEPVAVTSSAAALGTATNRLAAKNAVVLSLQPAGAELSAQVGGHTSALRHLRAPSPESLFLSELRRVVSTLPHNGSVGSVREVVVWDGAGLPSGAFGEMLGGMSVRSGDLPSLGVATSEAARNGGGRKYAPAVALAMAALAGGADDAAAAAGLPVDFLHSRLAAVPKARVAPWMIWSGVAVLLVVGTIAFTLVRLQQGQAELTRLQDAYKAKEPRIRIADEFVSRVAFAQRWHSGDPRYLACLSDVTKLFPDTGDIYATQVTLRNKDTKVDASKNATAATRAAADARHVMVSITGMAPRQDAAITLHKRFEENRVRFIDLKPLSTSQTAGRNPEINFSFSCEYVPPDKPPASLLQVAADAANRGGGGGGGGGGPAASTTAPATSESTTREAEPQATTNPTTNPVATPAPAAAEAVPATAPTALPEPAAPAAPAALPTTPAPATPKTE